MRPGLLAVGIILLILGAMGYFLMDDTAGVETETTSDTTTGVAGDRETASVQTETYANGDDEDLNETSSNDDTETTSDRTTTSTTTTTSSDFETTADVNEEGVPVAYVYLDDQGNMYNEDGQFLGSGLSSSDTTTTVSDRYGATQTETVSDNSATGTSNGGLDVSGSTVSDTQTTSDTTYDQSAGIDANQQTTSDRTTLVGSDDDTETTAVSTAAGGSNLLRTLSILAMVIGALLTILGLVLPNRDDVAVREHHTRTTGASGRRVYEREEEHRK